MGEEQQPRGVHNPLVVDLVTGDDATGEVVLVMLEERPWGTDPEQLRQLEAKFNAYLGYVLDGHMVQQYPHYAGRKIRFQLDCVTSPSEDERPFLTSAINFAAGEEIEFVVNVIGAPAEGPSAAS